MVKIYLDNLIYDIYISVITEKFWEGFLADHKYKIKDINDYTERILWHIHNFEEEVLEDPPFVLNIIITSVNLLIKKNNK